MNPTFLPHTALDFLGAIEAATPSPKNLKFRERQRLLRDQAIAADAQVLIVCWQNLGWTLLAIKPPADVQISDASELIPELLLNTKAMQEAQQAAREGRHMQWLVLSRPAATQH